MVRLALATAAFLAVVLTVATTSNACLVDPKGNCVYDKKKKPPPKPPEKASEKAIEKEKKK